MIKKFAAATGFAAVLAAASISIAQASPNSNATDNANQHAQDRGLGVAGVAGGGPAAVLSAVQGFAPAAAQGGLSNALSHVPVPPTTTTAAPTP